MIRLFRDASGIPITPTIFHALLLTTQEEQRAGNSFGAFVERVVPQVSGTSGALLAGHLKNLSTPGTW